MASLLLGSMVAAVCAVRFSELLRSSEEKHRNIIIYSDCCCKQKKSDAIPISAITSRFVVVEHNLIFISLLLLQKNVVVNFKMCHVKQTRIKKHVFVINLYNLLVVSFENSKL